VSKVRVHNLSVSLDGFAAGEGQSVDAPFGHAGTRLVDWMLGTRSFQRMLGSSEGGTVGMDDAFAARWAPGVGAEIMGRNKFGPQRGPWHDDGWKGWWGDDPVFHTPVFVLTHFPRPPLVMDGGTTFYFIDAAPGDALAAAQEAADGRDVRIGGGAQTVRQFLAADLIDHLHVVVVPILLGRGEPLWAGLEGIEERFDVESVSSPSGVTHVTWSRRPRVG
jgi:dihydrofolate reductase